MKNVIKILSSLIILAGAMAWSVQAADKQLASVVVTEEQNFIDLVEKILPSVVSVVGNDVSSSGSVVSSKGSGFVVSADGLVITNKHVVNDDLEYEVIFPDGPRFEAAVVAKDPVNDLAILKIEASGLRSLPLADSDQVKIGQTAIAVGNSLGRYPNTVTKGIVSGLGRAVTAFSADGLAEALDSVIQTDAAINNGNSGGPLINSKGQVIGVNSAVEVDGRGVAFAIPSNEVSFILKTYAANKQIVRPYLGVRYLSIDREVQILHKLPYNYGAYITAGSSLTEAVVKDSPAEKAGLKNGDIILSVNNELLRGRKSLRSVIQKYAVGDTVTISVWSENELKNISVTLVKSPQ